MNFFKKFQTPILFGLILILAGGIFAYKNIQISLFPEITFPKIKIIADNGEQPVDKMMITVTKPLENALKLVPQLNTLRSTTSRGSCEISAFLKWDSDIYNSLQQVEARISEIRNILPPDTKITVERMDPTTLTSFGYSLESDNKSLIELKKLGEYTIKPYLSQIPGISAVLVLGGKTKEFWIEINPVKLTELAITPLDISNSLQKTGFIQSNGYMSDYRRLYLTITDAGLYDQESIENTVIQFSGGRVLRIKDIGLVKVSEKVEYIKVNANGREGVLINILRQPNTNIITLSEQIKTKIIELKSILPEGVILKPYYDQAEFVGRSIRSLFDALVVGLFLAVFIAILFLRSTNANLTLLLIIPITLCSTLLVLLVLHYTLNIMTIGAIAAAIGLIIDDAIVVIEQMHRTHEENPDEPVPVITGKAIKFLLPAMIGSSLSTIVIFIPFSLMSGVAGAYFKVLAYTMIITLSCSFLVTAICLPALYTFLSKYIKIKIKTKHSIHTRKWVNFFIHKPAISIIFILVLIAGSLFIYPKLETGFLPEMDEGSIVLDFDSPPGTSIEETEMMLVKVDSIVLQTPEVISYSRRTGTQMGFFITEPSRGDYLIELTHNRNRSTDEVINDIRLKVEQKLPALIIDFGQVIGDMLGDLMSSVQPVEIKVFGNDRNKLEPYAKEIAQIVENTPGTADVFDGIVIAGPNINIKPKNDQLYKYGLSPEDLQFELQTQLAGVIVGTIQEKEQLTDIRMIFPKGPKMNTTDLSKSDIFLPGGKQVPLTEIADIETHKGVSEQERENMEPIIAVTARLNNRDLGSVMRDIQQEIKKNIHFPKGYGVIYGGSFAEQRASFKELLTILILASLLVLLVLLFLFRKLRIAFLILFMAVLGIGGSWIALFITHTPLNVGSYTGVIMIVGIIAENAIFTFQQFMANLESVGSDRDSAINYAISTRLRPKLMTALGAIIALSPLAFGIGTGAQLHQPLAIAVIGGFICALPLLLIVFPSILRILYSK